MPTLEEIQARLQAKKEPKKEPVKEVSEKKEHPEQITTASEKDHVQPIEKIKIPIEETTNETPINADDLRHYVKGLTNSVKHHSIPETIKDLKNYLNTHVVVKVGNQYIWKDL